LHFCLQAFGYRAAHLFADAGRDQAPGVVSVVDFH